MTLIQFGFFFLVLLLIGAIIWATIEELRSVARDAHPIDPKPIGKEFLQRIEKIKLPDYSRFITQDHNWNPIPHSQTLEETLIQLKEIEITLKLHYPYLSLTLNQILELKGKIYLLDQFIKGENKGNVEGIKDYEEYILRDEWKEREYNPLMGAQLKGTLKVP